MPFSPSTSNGRLNIQACRPSVAGNDAVDHASASRTSDGAQCTYTVRVDLWNYEQVEPQLVRRELWIQDLPDGVPHKLTLKMELVPRVEVGVVTLHKLPKGGAVFELGKGPRRSQLPPNCQAKGASDGGAEPVQIGSESDMKI